MQNNAKMKAEQRFALTQKKTMQAPNDKEKAQQERGELTAKLRTLRLAKENVDNTVA